MIVKARILYYVEVVASNRHLAAVILSPHDVTAGS